jgi:hypothetical protein
VGQNNLEEIDRVTPGGNYGWNRKEGAFPFDPATGTVNPPTADLLGGLTDPVAEYDHDEGIAVVGGFVYRGTAIPQLLGKYVFGDLAPSFTIANGRLVYTDLTPTSPDYGVVRELTSGLDNRSLGLVLKRFGEDASGELYVLASSRIGPLGTRASFCGSRPCQSRRHSVYSAWAECSCSGGGLGGGHKPQQPTVPSITSRVSPPLPRARQFLLRASCDGGLRGRRDVRMSASGYQMNGFSRIGPAVTRAQPQW